MNNRFWWFAIIILLLVIVVLAWLLWATPAPSNTVATSTAATTTSTNEGSNTTSTATSSNNSGSSVVNPIVSSPVSGATVASSFTVSGKAPGGWFFEASFPIEIRSASGTVIASGQAQAQSDWMTAALVPFTSSITVTGYTGNATIVLKKDNPSGLPQNDASISIPIVIQ